MALIRRASDIRSKRPDGPGWKETRERLLAGPAQGCDRFTFRLVSLKPDGSTPRMQRNGTRTVLLLEGEVLLMDGDGALSKLSTGDVAVIRPGERHQFINQFTSTVRMVQVDDQR